MNRLGDNVRRFRIRFGTSRILLRPAIPVLLLLAWHLIASSGSVPRLFLPSPTEVFTILVGLAIDPSFYADVRATLLRSFFGFTTAVLAGVSLGFLMGSSDALCELLEPVVDFARSIPISAAFPLFLLFFGLGDAAKIGLVVLGCSLIILVNTLYGVRNASQTRKMVLRQLGAGQISILWRVTLWDALPQVVAGLRIAVSLALVLVLVTEMWVGSNEGIGHRIMESYQIYKTPETFAAIIVAGLLGYSVNLALVLLETRYVHWGGK